jgi:hypothetical protein
MSAPKVEIYQIRAGTKLVQSSPSLECQLSGGQIGATNDGSWPISDRLSAPKLPFAGFDSAGLTGVREWGNDDPADGGDWPLWRSNFCRSKFTGPRQLALFTPD